MAKTAKRPPSTAQTTGRPRKARGGPRPLRLEWIEAGSLASNPRNWRRHPEGQTKALKAVLADPDVGWAGALLYNERTRRLIDGHARKDLVPPKTPVPVLVGSWSDEAERRILASLDPLAAMAEVDAGRLQALMAETPLDLPGLDGLRAALEATLDAAIEADTPPPGPAPKGGEEQIPEQWVIVIECDGEAQQTELLERFLAEGLKCRAVTS